MDWIGRSSVTARGKRWFPGQDGFVTGSLAIIGDLSDMHIVRNRIAHDSGDAQTKFRISTRVISVTPPSVREWVRVSSSRH